MDNRSASGPSQYSRLRTSRWSNPTINDPTMYENRPDTITSGPRSLICSATPGVYSNMKIHAPPITTNKPPIRRKGPITSETVKLGTSLFTNAARTLDPTDAGQIDG